MKLKKLIKDLDIKILGSCKDVEITGLSSNSKFTAPGEMFVAKRGRLHDGNQYAEEALLAGASCLLTDIFNPFLGDVTQLITNDLNSVEGLLAKRYYDNPSSKIFLIGVTGTNGKTTTTYLIKHILDVDAPTGIIGTIENIIGEVRIDSNLTTPDVITSNKIFKEMIANGVKNCAMEVSSHALNQNRIVGIEFDVAIFTNLSQEHLDYHITMDEYFNEKSKLFSHIKDSGVAIINRDDVRSSDLIKICTNRVVTYGLSKGCDYYGKNLVMTSHDIRFTLDYHGCESLVNLPLIGEFNVYNALAAIATANIKGVSIDKIVNRLKTFSGVPGRMERVRSDDGRNIFVDFAHTADALEKTLIALKIVTSGKIITIFGCGGDRDKEKRPNMARIAEKYSNHVIVTSDNPRGEDPNFIVEQIIGGFNKNIYEVELDRKKAIEKGISMISGDDVLLIAGRGHEKKQIFSKKIVKFNDTEVANEILNLLV